MDWVFHAAMEKSLASDLEDVWDEEDEEEVDELVEEEEDELLDDGK